MKGQTISIICNILVFIVIYHVIASLLPLAGITTGALYIVSKTTMYASLGISILSGLYLVMLAYEKFLKQNFKKVSLQKV